MKIIKHVQAERCRCWHCTRMAEVVNVCDVLRSDVLRMIEDRRRLLVESERLIAENRRLASECERLVVELTQLRGAMIA